jgi:two-component system, OmpR family, phosphate regulon sensor histidine kinase PhoR
MSNVPIRWKIAFSTLLAVTLGLLLAGWLALRSFQDRELSQLEEALASQTGLAAVSIEPLLQADRVPTPRLQALTERLSRHASARVTLISPDGVVLADSDTADDGIARMDNHRTRPEVARALAGGRGTDMRLSATTGKHMFYLALPVQAGDRVIGVVRLALPITTIQGQIRDLQESLALAFGLALVVAAVLSVLLSRGLTRPLSDMVKVAQQLASGAFSHRIRSTSMDEVGVLGKTLNQMAERLESTIRELTEDRAQLLAVLSSMLEGVMVLDCRGRVLQVNPALERMLFIRGPEARGRSHWEVIRHEEFNTLVARVLDARQSQSGEISTAAGGQTFRVEAAIAGGRRDNEACVVLVFHDVTALRRLEKVRKDFVANVSHELRTPLTSIKGYVEALLDGVKDQPDQASRFLDIILKQSDRLNLILEDLLQLSQIESGQVLFKVDPVSVRSVAERTMALIQPIADKKGHRIELSMPGDLPCVLGDAERLVQVLTNLLDNAVKYTPDGGKIGIEARRAEGSRTDTQQHDWVDIIVADNGIGIPAADRPRVFERFYRVDKARSRELGGTGLGLAIVKHIVEAHGGHIWVEGNQPAGTRVVMRLPAVAAQADVTTATTAARTDSPPTARPPEA